MSENLFLAFGLIKSKALACELTLEVQIVNGYTFVRSVDNILTTLSRSELEFLFNFFFFFFFVCVWCHFSKYGVWILQEEIKIC
jgi:hypothetical protein